LAKRIIGAVIPLWLKIADTLFVYLIVPIYWRRYGPANFLWFSDVALLLTVPALWLESPLLVSMMALAVALPELAWNIDFFVRLTTGVPLLGLAAYMFDRRIPRFVRSLSLFHVGLPLRRQIRDIDTPQGRVLWSLAIPAGWLLYRRDVRRSAAQVTAANA